MAPAHQVLALNEKARKQSASGPPVEEMVTVAVLPPRLPPGMAPADGSGTAEAVSWDANVNALHNRLLPPKDGEQTGSATRLRRKAGLTTQRKKTHEMPPFRMRTVPYDVWRKHYAKDKDGNYMGTHAPAEDCLLKPDDVQKWSAEEPETYADTYTRGRRTLPGYGDITEQNLSLPEYTETTGQHHASPERKGLSGRTMDGKTTEQIIADASAREANQPKKGWRKLLS